MSDNGSGSNKGSQNGDDNGSQNGDNADQKPQKKQSAYERRRAKHTENIEGFSLADQSGLTAE